MARDLVFSARLPSARISARVPAEGRGCDRSPRDVSRAPVEAQAAKPPIRAVSAKYSAEINRTRVAADLAGQGARVALWLAASLAFGFAAMSLFSRLCEMEAAARAAAGV